jgi:hypothetical protein
MSGAIHRRPMNAVTVKSPLNDLTSEASPDEAAPISISVQPSG